MRTSVRRFVPASPPLWQEEATSTRPMVTAVLWARVSIYYFALGPNIFHGAWGPTPRRLCLRDLSVARQCLSRLSTQCGFRSLRKTAACAFATCRSIGSAFSDFLLSHFYFAA